jgi:drug/metabolite transporter (DMT)-like permease
MPAWAEAIWRRPYLLLWLPPAFWAGNLVLGRGLADTMPPVSLAVGRWLVAFMLLLPFTASGLWRQRSLLWRHRWLVLLCGSFGIAGYNALAYVALHTVPAVNVAFLNSTLPLMIPAVAFLLGRETVSWRTLLGIAVSFAGVCWIVSRGDVSLLLAMQFGRADLPSAQPRARCGTSCVWWLNPAAPRRLPPCSAAPTRPKRMSVSACWSAAAIRPI